LGGGDSGRSKEFTEVAPMADGGGSVTREGERRRPFIHATVVRKLRAGQGSNSYSMGTMWVRRCVVARGGDVRRRMPNGARRCGARRVEKICVAPTTGPFRVPHRDPRVALGPSDAGRPRRAVRRGTTVGRPAVRDVARACGPSAFQCPTV
jgi:hypothetical protein